MNLRHLSPPQPRHDGVDRGAGDRDVLVLEHVVDVEADDRKHLHTGKVTRRQVDGLILLGEDEQQIVETEAVHHLAELLGLHRGELKGVEHDELGLLHAPGEGAAERGRCPSA